MSLGEKLRVGWVGTGGKQPSPDNCATSDGCAAKELAGSVEEMPVMSGEWITQRGPITVHAQHTGVDFQRFRCGVEDCATRDGFFSQ